MDFANQVAKLCFDKYNNLKNSGKPRDNEWTVVSGVVLRNSTGTFSVVSLCTGTKCLSGSELMDTSLWKRGSRLSDSHAEVLARRAFLRYLYHQIDVAQKNGTSDIFRLVENEVKLLDDTRFHFFSSQSPCGDCSIIPKSNNTIVTETQCKILKLDENIENDDIHRTGAKCLLTEEKQDTYGSGNEYHVVGPLRTKPGRGDRTLSLSCSDKIARWIVTGVQGSLLSMIISSIRFDSIIIGGGCPFSIESMKRGLYKRFNHNFEVPEIYQATLSFQCMKNLTRSQPCSSSIIWCNVPNRNTEVAVEGRRQGATKKNKGHDLLISRVKLLENFFKVLECSSTFQNISRHPKKINYHFCKQASRNYQENWTNLKKDTFGSWPAKPQELQYFAL